MSISARKSLESAVGPLTFGMVLKSNRLCEEWTQEQLAKKIGVTKVAISQFETGKSFPKKDTLNNIVKAFGLTIDMFLPYILQDVANQHGKYTVEVKKVG